MIVKWTIWNTMNAPYTMKQDVVNTQERLQSTYRFERTFPRGPLASKSISRACQGWKRSEVNAIWIIDPYSEIDKKYVQQDKVQEHAGETDPYVSRKLNRGSALKGKYPKIHTILPSYFEGSMAQWSYASFHGHSLNRNQHLFKGVLHLWALFLKTLCIFSKNKATSDKVSYGSGQKCSKELENYSFTSVETIVVKLQWKMCENQYFPCFEP